MRHIVGAQNLTVRIDGNQVFRAVDRAGHEELILMGFLEAVPGELSSPEQAKHKQAGVSTPVVSRAFTASGVF